MTAQDPLRATGPDGRAGQHAALRILAGELVDAIRAGEPHNELLAIAERLQERVPPPSDALDAEEFGFDRQQEGTIVDALRSAGLKLIDALPGARRHPLAIDIRTLPLAELALTLPEIAQEIAHLKREQRRKSGPGTDRQSNLVLQQITREIRGPIRNIADELARLAGTSASLEQRERIESAEDSAELILHLVNDLVDLTKLRNGRFAPEKLSFRVRDCVAATLLDLEPRARAAGIAIRHAVAAEVPALVEGDPGRIRHVLATLAGNAIASMRGGALLVSATLHATREGHAVLRFTTQSQSEKRRISSQERTRRGAAMWRGGAASGLGLSIARQLVSQMGGRTWVESTTGGGNALNFTVTVKPCAPTRRSSPAIAVDAIEARRVLIVENDVGGAGPVPPMIRRLGPDVEVVRNEAAARAALYSGNESGQPFDVCLVCGDLGDRLTRDNVEAIGAMEADARPPLAVITPEGQRGDATVCRRFGVAGYLTMPVADRDLSDMLRALFDPELAAEIRRHSLLTRHYLRELRGRLLVEVVGASPAENEGFAVRLRNIGHAATIGSIDRPVALLDDAVVPDVIAVPVDGDTRAISTWLDAALRRYTLMAGRRPGVLAMGPGEMVDGGRFTDLLDGRCPADADDDQLAVTVAEIAATARTSSATASLGRRRLIDVSALRRRMADDDGLVRELAGLFLRDSQRMLDAVRDAVAASDGKRLVRTTDTLRGGFEIFDVKTGVDLCLRLSAAGHAEDFSEVVRLVARLERIAAEVTSELSGDLSPLQAMA